MSSAAKHGDFAHDDSTVVTPSALSRDEVAAWHAMMAATPALQRAFFAPAFALACERAHGRARVAVLRRKGQPVGFFPFQYPSPWHKALGSAECIGGLLCDHAGLIATPGFRIDPPTLLEAAGLTDFFVDHLSECQPAFGLAADEWHPGHIIDLRAGSEAYFTDLLAAKASFASDTRRRLRRAEASYGALEFTLDMQPEVAAARDLLNRKREQYARTAARDPFDDHSRLALVEALFAQATPQCRPVIASLRAGSHVLGRHLGLLSHDVLSYWFPVYDVAAKAVSPGRLLLWLTIEAAEAHGIGFIDRGVGDTQAKRDFSNGQARFGKLELRSSGPRAFLARAQRAIHWRLGRHG